MNEIKCSLIGYCNTYQEALEMRKDYPIIPDCFTETNCSSGFFPYKKKDGNLGRLKLICGASYTILNQCEGCGKLGGIHKIYYRENISGWMRSSFKYKIIGDNIIKCPERVCDDCLDKIKPLSKKTVYLDFIESLLKRINQTRLKIQRG